MILFRRHVIYGPEAAIPPRLDEAMSELRRLQAAKRMEAWDEFEVGRIADLIERLLNRWSELQEEYEDELVHPFGVPS